MSRAGPLNRRRLVLARSHRVCPGRRLSRYRSPHRERGPILLAPIAQLSSRRPRVRPGMWPRARWLDLSLAVGRRPDGASRGAPRQPELSAKHGRRRREPGGWRRRRRRCGSCGQRRHSAGAASPALIGPSPATSAGNCYLGVGTRGVLKERKGRRFRSGD